MRGEHYSKRPRPEENSGTYVGETLSSTGRAVRLRSVESWHNQPGDRVVGGMRRNALARAVFLDLYNF
jgi:hypothetical protein